MTEEFGRICAVVVTYNIGSRYLENFLAVKDQVDKVIIVDNGSDTHTRDVIKKIEKENKDKVETIFYSTNYGLGKAQNAGIKKAISHGFQWVLLLDHDSRPEPDMVKNMASAWNTHPKKDKIAVIGPYISDVNTRQEPKYIVPSLGIWFTRKTFTGDIIDDALAVIAAGSMIRTAVLVQEGYMREDFFIDYIDVEFSLRLISHGWKIMAVRNAVLNHEIGNKKVINIFGRKIITSNHSAERRYSIYKNRCYVWRKYILKAFPYIIYDILAANYDVLRVSLFEEEKGKKLLNMFKGALSSLKVKDARY